VVENLVTFVVLIFGTVVFVEHTDYAMRFFKTENSRISCAVVAESRNFVNSKFGTIC
jgi:hypothetical protein